MDGIYESILSFWDGKSFTKAEEYNIQGTIIPDLPFEMAQN